MNQPLKKENAAVRTNLKSILKGFDDLQTTLNLSPQDADSKLIVTALQYITTHLDDPNFPTADDKKILDAAIKLAVKAGNDNNIDLQKLYDGLNQ